MSYGLSLTTVPKDLYYVERKLVADQAAEIERLSAVISNDDEYRHLLHTDNAQLRAAMQEACDMLAERTYGSPARSPGHNARIRLESALTFHAGQGPPPTEKP